MRHTSNSSRYQKSILIAMAAIGMACSVANAGLTVIGTQYQQDDPLTEYQCLWHYGDYPTACGGTMTGCNVHVYLKNTGGSSVTVSNVTLAGYSLSTILKLNTSYNSTYSIFYYWDNPPQAVFDAGEPVWYKADPKTVPAGGFTNVVVRLRWVPVTQPVNIGVIYNGGTTTTTVAVDANAPQLAGVSFSSDRKKIYLSWRRSGGAGPTTIKMDDVDVTASATTVSDANCNYASSVLTFGTALTNMSYHVYQGVYSDGKTATASLPTWVNPFVHCTWGAKDDGDGNTEAAKDYIDDATNRFVNTMEMNGSGSVNDLVATSSGRQYCADRGFGFSFDDIGQWSIPNPTMWFLDDEPDNEDYNMSDTHCGTGLRLVCGRSPIGIIAMRELATVDTLKASYLAPTTINIAGAYKPECYYAYGQVSDVFCADPYYQARLRDIYWNETQQIPLFQKATYIYATSIAMCKGAEPNPHRLILYANEYRNSETMEIWPFPDPGCKRMEAYYALAGGAKGLGYWWFNPGYPCNGLGDGGPEAMALWKEIGLYGNEIKTIQPQIVTSVPVAMTVTPSANVWAKALTQGTDTVILYAINDNYYNDETLHYTSVANATVTCALPSWMTSPTPSAFEVRASGLYDITTSLNGSNLTVQLGTLDITKMIVITTNSNLRSTVQARYVSEVWPKVCAFASDHCVAQNAPPSITAQPVDTTVGVGDTASFTVTVTGSTPISYQWKKNGTNIAGATSATLQLTNVQASDAADYSCYISNSYGNVTSDSATLTIGASNRCIVNADAEAGFTAAGGGYIANNWTEWESASGVTTGYDETVTVHGGGHSQRIRVWGAASSSGGVYQKMPATNGSPYTVTAYIYAYDASSSCYLGVDKAGGTSATSGNITWSTATTSQSWVQKSVTVTASSSYITVFYKVVASDTAKRNGYFDDATPVCQAVTAPSITQQPTNQIVGLGGTANFSITAEGTPTLTYQWKKDGSNIAGATSAALQITNCQLTDAASYTCYVANDYGNVTSSAATLTVSTSGVITNANFEYSTAANPPYGWTTYIQSSKSGNWTIQTASPQEGTQWQQTQVYNASSYGGIRQVVTGLASGTIYNVTGYYKTNSTSATASIRYNLSGNTDRANSTSLVSTSGTNWTSFNSTVTASGTSLMLFLDNLNGTSTNKASGFDNLKVSCTPVVTQQPVASSICAAANTSFTVAATGAGTLTYQWQKNSTNQANGGHYSGCTTATLTITGADTNDAANYRCVVTNGAGSTNSNQATLTIKTATTISAHPSAQTVCTGNSGVFTVTATGDGALTYQWQKSSTNLTEGGHYTGVAMATLTVSPADTNDAADYRCVVTGGCGSANSNQAALTIKTATTISTHPSDKVTCSGSNTTFTVAATGDGTLTYQWLKDDMYMSNGGHYSGVTTATLTITGADTNDAAYYACLVTGGCDNATSNEALLTISTAASLTNGNFETSTAGNPPSGWTTYIQTSKSGAFTIQTVSPPQGTQYQQTQVYNTGAFGGVRQNVTGLTSGAIYTISGTYKANSTSATAAVRYNLSGNTDRSNSTALVSKSTTSWGTFSADVTASGSSLMLFLDHLNGSSTNKASTYDNIKVTCKP